MKQCRVCSQTKLESEFNMRQDSSDGFRSECKICQRILNREATKKWRANNPQYFKNWYQENRDYWREKATQYYRSHKAEMDKAKLAYQSRRLKIDPQFRLARYFSKLVWHSLRKNKVGRHWESLVGYTLGKLKKHLEAQFKVGMSWNNYGKWQIDHIKPVSSFNFQTPEDEDFQICWSLTNLQPLWARENLDKRAKII